MTLKRLHEQCETQGGEVESWGSGFAAETGAYYHGQSVASTTHHIIPFYFNYSTLVKFVVIIL